ncbi:MAG: threonylcarbamoyl-AMP synthase [Victivallales bacterium]|nr:threonylcarbamoyl-AMP synthase [Victivallales bacterium]
METLLQDSPLAISRAAAELRCGHVIAAPTETVYGLMAIWKSADARQEIYRLKHRPADKRLQMLAPDVETAVMAGLKPNAMLKKIGDAFWPGPLTVIVEANDGDTIGLRIPNHPFILKLLRELGEPLAATSANLSGTPAAITPSDAVANLDGRPALLIDGGEVTVTGGASSTVVSIVGGELKILRQGPITQEDIQKVLGG